MQQISLAREPSGLVDTCDAGYAGGIATRLRVLLVGIAGTSADFLLSLPVLRSYLRQDAAVEARCDIRILHHKYILPAALEADCDAIFGEIAAFRPDLVGFSTYVWNIGAVTRLARAVRERLPGTRIALGGPEIAANDIVAGRFDGFPLDFAIVGEGEIPLQRLLLQCLSGGADGLEDIPRLCYRRNGALSRSGLSLNDAGLIVDLAAAPSAYLNGDVPAAVLDRPGTRANVETQRGCSFRCAYCLYHAHYPSIRYRSAAIVLDELQSIYGHGIEHCRITDANFLSSPRHAAAILGGMIERGIRMSLFFEAIPSFVDDSIAALIGEFGALSPKNEVMVGIGLQSIHPESLRAIRRNLPIRHFDGAYERLLRANAVVKTDVILGLPHESLESYIKLLEYVAEKVVRGSNWLSLALLRILPGTELEATAQREDLILDKRDSEHFVYATPTLPRADMLTCLQLSTVAFRLLHAPGAASQPVRERYFQVKSRVSPNHARMLFHFVRFFFATLENSGADFVKEDYPNAEHYWYFDVHRDLPDAVLLGEFDRIEREGL
jgi:radical SAM superfamily enzyme YgiQ (UPF0313 family)